MYSEIGEKRLYPNEGCDSLLAVTTHISQESTPVQCNILVLVGWSEEENCLLADHSEEVQLVYLFCIILANTKTPAVAQGTMLDQIWLPVTGNCTKYFGSQLGLLITSQLLQVFIKVIFLSGTIKYFFTSTNSSSMVSYDNVISENRCHLFLIPVCSNISAQVWYNCYRITMLFKHSKIMSICSIDSIVYSNI